MGALGLPGTTGFIGEFLILVGVFQKNYLVAVISSVGVILAAAYMLWLAKRVIFGETTNANIKTMKDVNFIEGTMLLSLIIMTIVFGFYPEPLINTMSVSVDNLIENYQLQLTKGIAKIN